MTGRNRKAKRGDVVRIFLERQDQFEPLTAREVAGELDVTRKTAYNRLEELAGEGCFETKKTGAKGRVWWPASDVWYPDVSEIELKNRSVEQVLERLERSTVLAEEELPPVVQREIEQLELPGEDELLNRRLDAVREAYEVLAELGEADRMEILDAMDIDPVELGYQDEDSFWRNLMIKHRVMGQLSGVIVPTEGGRYYRYVGVEA